jgi:Fe-S cluster biogenesis protein NfuA
MKFLPGKPVMSTAESLQFSSYKEAQVSPLAKALMTIDGVDRVFFGGDFVTVTLKKDHDWLVLRPQVFAAITDYYSSGEPIVNTDTGAPADKNAQINDDDDEVIAMIKELIYTRIRPAVQEDGGDIQFRGYEKGIVKVELQGSCVGCASSSITLKHGIENMLMHYIPEVEGVENIEAEYPDELPDEAETRKMEEALAKIKPKPRKLP